MKPHSFLGVMKVKRHKRPQLDFISILNTCFYFAYLVCLSKPQLRVWVEDSDGKVLVI